MIEGALSDVGGKDYLIAQASSNPTAFLGLVKGLLPKDLNVSGSVSVSLCDALKELPEK